ncbi:MAG: thiol peroxidase [Candidatus Omnitrophica bacterium]|nr:thiol peroxidase [Candidatus Omnitrophota bacterium]
MEERKGAVTLKGSPVTLLGREIRIGDKAPAFSVLNQDMETVNSGKFSGKIRVIAAVPSLDTPICDSSIKRFNDEATRLSKDVVVLFISMDLPFAQKRFCQDNNIKRVKTLSDYRDADFGEKFGVLIKELRLLARAVFIVDKDETVRYVEHVKEIATPPDYESALEAIKKLV